MIYRFISKVLANRTKVILLEIIKENQHAFVKGQSIHENIMLCYELMHVYKEENRSSNMAIKIDLQKAYDFVRWDFVASILHDYKFPPWIISRILSCIQSPTFTINVNGQDTGFFTITQGLRQGYPMAPYSIIMIMQHLTDLLFT